MENFLPIFFGYVSTFCFTSQYFPQTILNFRRKSVKGFSTTGILIKLCGASFFMMNCLLQKEATPSVVYGFFNVFQHAIFMFQFAYYKKRPSFLIWCLFPLIPWGLGQYFPWTFYFTNSIKPISQVLSHFPQLYETYVQKSSKGVSLFTQHLNIIGGFSGIYMYLVIPPKSWMTYFVFINSIFQAVSLYSLALWYDGWKELFRNEFGKMKGELLNPTENVNEVQTPDENKV